MSTREQAGRGGSWLNRVRQRAQERETFGQGGRYVRIPEGMEWWKPTKGNHLIDILPYEVTVENNRFAAKGELWYEKSYKVHKHVGVEDNSYVCPGTVGKRCPICEEAARRRKEPRSPERDEVLKALTPKERQLFNVIDLNDEAKGVQLWDFSFHNFGKELEKELNPDENPDNEKYNSFPDLESGYSIKLRLDEVKGGGYTFMEAGRIDFRERDPYPKTMLDKVADLDSLLVILPYDELERIFMGADADPDKAAEEEPAPRRRAPAEDADLAPKRRAAEPEPEPTPSRRRAAAEPEQEAAPAAEPSARRRVESDKEPAPAAKTEEAAGPACPDPDGEFGRDCDQLDSCAKCKDDVWDKCRKATDAANAARSTRRR